MRRIQFLVCGAVVTQDASASMRRIRMGVIGGARARGTSRNSTQSGRGKRRTCPRRDKDNAGTCPANVPCPWTWITGRIPMGLNQVGWHQTLTFLLSHPRSKVKYNCPMRTKIY